MSLNRLLHPIAVAALLPVAGCAASEPTGTPAPSASHVRVDGLFAVTTQSDGAVVVDGRGYVLYRSSLDGSSPARSACTGDCAAEWLPVPTASGLQLSGINRELVGTYRRPDGQSQLTLAGWPLYEYTGDRMPGDTTGKGIDGHWLLVRPDGTAG